jgi:hypothetical protein
VTLAPVPSCRSQLAQNSRLGLASQTAATKFRPDRTPSRLCPTGKFSKLPKRPLPDDRIGRALFHQQIAEDLLHRSERAGFFDVLTETRLATIATAHATLALSYLAAPSEVQDQRAAEAS